MTRRRLFLIAFLVVAGFGGYMLFFANKGSSTLNLKQTGARQVALAHRHHVKPHIRPSARHQYAIQILPALDRSRKAFDRALSAVSNADSSTVDTVCGNYGSDISILSTFLDGIAHSSWYSQVGSLHHSIMGVYHDMLGSLQSCQTSVSAGDSSILQTALADMSNATSRMRSTDDYVRWLTHQK